MYKKLKLPKQQEFENFYLPFGGELHSDNRWVKLSKLIPWEQCEELFEKQFSEGKGAPAKSLRVALGALLIKDKCGFTDRETVLQIQENPYLQYFLGFGEYSDKKPFDASMMVHFRKRLSFDFLSQVNELIIDCESNGEEPKDIKDDDNEKPNKGKLIIDATCTPADIRYPTDISLLNEAREKLEKYIDIFHMPSIGKKKKPRTYKRKARYDFLFAIKSKMKGKNGVRKAVRKQLGYVRRNLRHIGDLLKDEACLLKLLTRKQYKNLLVIGELFRQQEEMYVNKTHTTPNRIVSVTQPHVRAIVRGKAGNKVEFGSKISLSLVNGYARVDHLSWENYHEGIILTKHLDIYYSKYGCHPESVHVDQIYRTRENRKLCKLLNIRISGPALGRPPKETKVTKAQNKQRKQDLKDRVVVEGKFGEAKRAYCLDRIMTKLPSTSESTIAISIILMNLNKKLKFVFFKFIKNIFLYNMLKYC